MAVSVASSVMGLELLPDDGVVPAESAAPRRAEGFPGQRIVVLPRPVVVRLSTEPLLARLLPTDIGFYPHARGHYFERPRGADQAIFIYCRKGHGWCELRGERVAVGEGELLVVPAGEAHRYGAAEPQPWTIWWFHATGSDVGPLLGELGVRPESPVLFLGEDPRFPALFEEALEVMEHGYAPFQLLHASRTLAYLLSLMICRAREHWREAPDTRQRISSCIAFMKQHLDRPLRLTALAAIAGLSPSYFNVRFRKATGYSCMDYLTQLRIHQACQWLDTTDWPVKTIAARLGYDDPFYFSRVFSSIRGLSPKEYRRTHKG